MKRMKRRNFLLPVFACIAGICLSGCAVKDEAAENVLSDGNWYYDTLFGVSGRAGTFYMDGCYLRFFDRESGQDVLVCDKSDCDHEEDSCPAYFTSMLIPIPEESGLLLVTDLNAEKLGEINLYECSVNGENRKKTASLSQNMQNFMDALWTDRYIILAYWNQYDEDYEDLEKDEAGVFIYDRAEKKGRTLWNTENFGAHVSNLELRENELYFINFYSEYDKEETNALFDSGEIETLLNGGHTELLCMDLESGTVSNIGDGNVSEISLSDDGNGIYVLGEEKLELWREISDGQPENPDILLQGEGISILESHVERTKFFSVYDNETKISTYYMYDEDQGELSYIGEASGYGVSVILDETVYLYDYNTEDGNGRRAVLSYDSFLKGDFTDIICSDY